MARRTRTVDEFELVDLALSAGPAAAVARARELLAADRLPERTNRAQLLLELSDYLEMIGDLAGAEATAREAMADGGAVVPDPRLRVAELRVLQGDRAGCDALLAEVWRSRPAEVWDYHFAAELLEELDDATGALRWANTGVFRNLRDDRTPTDAELALLLTRRRLRLDMGFTEDDHDLLAVDEAERDLDDEFDDEFDDDLDDEFDEAFGDDHGAGPARFDPRGPDVPSAP